MTSHELAKVLLANPDLPVATHAKNHTYIDSVDKTKFSSLKVGLLESYGGQHIIIGDMSKLNINKPNWYISRMIVGEAPEEWRRWR